MLVRSLISDVLFNDCSCSTVADRNDAANIDRKELGDEWLRKLLELDGGVLVDTTAVVRNLHASENIRQWLELGTRSQETAHVSER